MALRRSVSRVLLGTALSLTLAVPALADNPFGAIAISPSNGTAGGSWNWKSQGDANSHALSACRSRSNGANDCLVAQEIHQHLCGAVAFDKSAGRWRGGVANVRADARSAALNNLGSSSGRILESVCNSTQTKSTGASTTEAAVAGLLLGAAAVAVASQHHRAAASPTPSPSPSASPSVVYVPAPVQPVQAPAYIPTQGGVPPAAAQAGGSQYVPVATRPFALVGLRTHVSDVVNAIVPLYAGIDAGNTLLQAVAGQMVGGAGGGETVFQPAGGYVLTGLDVYRASYKGNDEVVGLRIYWSKLTPTGIDAAGGITSNVMASNTPPNLAAKSLRANAGSYISNLVITPSTHPDGSTYVHDLSIVTTAL